MINRTDARRFLSEVLDKHCKTYCITFHYIRRIRSIKSSVTSTENRIPICLPYHYSAFVFNKRYLTASVYNLVLLLRNLFNNKLTLVLFSDRQ